MIRCINIAYDADLYEFYVNCETCEILEVRVSRYNRNAESTLMDLEDLPFEVDDLLYSKLKKLI